MRASLRMHRSAHCERAAAWHVISLLSMALMLGACAASPPASTVVESLATPAAPVAAKAEIAPYVPNTYCSMQASDPIYARCKVKLGLPKEEATAVLTESQRKFLDGVMRIYTEPGFLIHRKEAIAALGAEVASTKVSHTTWPDGRRAISRQTDVFKGGGLFTPYEYWASTYTYLSYRNFLANDVPYRWGVRISVAIDAKRECLPSRAVEGYLDIPLSSRIFGAIHGDGSREKWDRHGFGGTAIAERLNQWMPRLEVDFLRGCLSAFRLEGNFYSTEVSDEKILN